MAEIAFDCWLLVPVAPLVVVTKEEERLLADSSRRHEGMVV